jgi:dTDP-glucose 4,6-dehydratase
VRILVTGVGGFLGSHVLDQLIHAEHDVIGVDSLNHNGDSLRVAEATTCLADDAKFTWTCHDLAAPFTYQQVGKIGKLDAIIHVASLASVDQSIFDPVTFVNTNVNSTMTMLELARLTSPKRYVHMSTDEVYGSITPCAEGQHAPSSPYAASKAAQEDLCNAWRETFDVPVTIVRSANMFGERQSELAFIPKVIRAVLNDDVVYIHVDRNGKPGTRNYTYVGNVAQHLIRVATQSTDDPLIDQTLRGQVTLDNFSLALNIATILDRELRYEFIDARRVRPGYDEKYELHGIDWSPEVSAGEALRRTVIDTARRLGSDV